MILNNHSNCKIVCALPIILIIVVDTTFIL